MGNISEKIKSNAEIMEKYLNKDNDVLIKKNKDGDAKIMYYIPRNIKND